MEIGRVLVLGARGMLGRELMKLYGRDRAVGWDRETFDFARLADVKADITKIKPDAIINCVAYNDVNRAETERDKAFKINAESVGELGKLCRELDIPVVHFSTNYVFDGKKGEYSEVDEPHPLSAYGASKYEGEKLLRQNCSKYYLVRTSVIFGTRVEGSESKESFVAFVLQKTKNHEPIFAYTDEIGSFTYAVDLARAAALLLEEQKPYGIYHIVNSGHGSRYELAEETLRLHGLLEGSALRPVTLQDRPRAANIPRKSVLLNTKLPGMRPWQEALAEYLNQES